jgi:hypothetical protein
VLIRVLATTGHRAEIRVKRTAAWPSLSSFESILRMDAGKWRLETIDISPP